MLRQAPATQIPYPVAIFAAMLLSLGLLNSARAGQVGKPSTPATPPPKQPTKPPAAPEGVPTPEPKPAETSPKDKAPAETKPAAPSLIDDLQASYAWCQNTKTLAETFAKSAETEGVPGAASLLRVTARSMEILSTQYAESVKKLGGIPTSKVEDNLPAAKTTKENLTAMATRLGGRKTGSLSESTTRQRSSSNREATKTFRFEREAITELARFSTDSADSVDKLKVGKKDYYVSRPCGYVVSELTAEKCPVCKAGRDQFEKVQ